MRAAVLAGLVLVPSFALAQPAPQDPPSNGGTAQGDLSVTIYSNDLALVQDIRRLDLPSGRTRQAFADVSAAIRPETVGLAAPDATVIEQNFDYDLLSPTSLMQKAVGETITLDGWNVQRRCPHLKADLTRFGSVEGDVLTCQMHGWKWRLSDGKCLTSVGRDIRSHRLEDAAAPVPDGRPAE